MTLKNEAVSKTPNPRRVIAGMANFRKRRGLTPEGRLKLQEAARFHQPWWDSTGPRSPEGKAKAALNGRRTKRGYTGVRALRREISAVKAMICQMQAARAEVISVLSKLPSKEQGT